MSRWLSTAHPAVFAAWAILAAFSTYFCMYAFRKPFAAASFADGTGLLGLDLKSLYVISQVCGYCLSKFVGIKVISEIPARRRALGIAAVMGVAWGALLLFALLPAPYNAICMFINGLPLGMVWGLVFGWLEGRKLTEVLGAGLSASYILASGAVKSVGAKLLAVGVPEVWMPAAAGALFALPMVGFVWMLAQLPPPTAEDEAQRSHRAPMDGAARWAFVRRFAPGILTLTGLHILLTSYRDFRDNFSREIYDAVGLAGDTAVFATAEVPVAAGVLVVLALMALIKDNRKALVAIHLIMAGGCALIGISTLLWTSGLIGPVTWMILVGLGLYIAYVPFGSMLFDRLFAATGAVGTAGFLIYVTDAFGYLGSVGLLFFKNFGFKELSWLDFFLNASYATAVVCGACFVFAAAYFGKVARRPIEG
ncbi:MAG: hypothetical protein JNM72_16580 [Deltaproteobacteria bacterium]|nr:hypothetical protein [Deltaproteobacteria bacterium]